VLLTIAMRAPAGNSPIVDNRRKPIGGDSVTAQYRRDGWGSVMNAFFTFQFSALSAGLSESNKWKWWGHCKAEVPLVEASRPQLTVQHIADFDLVSLLIVRHFDQQPATLEWRHELSDAQEKGTADAMEISHWPDLLGITIGLRSQTYEHFCAFLTQHFGRSELAGRIACSFYGFAEQPGLRLPNEEEFLKGKPYFTLGDHSLSFFRT
jgi:hypothetical protein